MRFSVLVVVSDKKGPVDFGMGKFLEIPIIMSKQKMPRIILLE